MDKIITAPPPKIQVGYDVSRTMIKDGDLLSFFKSHEETFLHKFETVPIGFFVGSKIFHSGIAMWMTTDTGDRRLMLCEAVGVGRRLVNLSKFKDVKFEVTSKPDNLDAAKIITYMLDGLTEGYAFSDLPKIMLKEFFGIKNIEGSTKGAVCSETAARAWEAGGMQFDTTVLSPGMLRNVLSQKGIPPSFGVNEDQAA